MVGSIYFILMPYSDFKDFKGRPILVFKIIDKHDGSYQPQRSRKAVVVN